MKTSNEGILPLHSAGPVLEGCLKRLDLLRCTLLRDRHQVGAKSSRLPCEVGHRLFILVRAKSKLAPGGGVDGTQRVPDADDDVVIRLGERGLVAVVDENIRRYVRRRFWPELEKAHRACEEAARV